MSKQISFFRGQPAALSYRGRWPMSRPSADSLIHCFETLIAWQDRARMRHRLRGLDDFQLKDIGLTRADVEREASRPFWRA